LAINFFNINNKFSDRKMTCVKYIYEIKYFGREDSQQKLKKLEKFRLLHKAFCIANKKVKRDNNCGAWFSMLKEIHFELYVQM